MPVGWGGGPRELMACAPWIKCPCVPLCGESARLSCTLQFRALLDVSRHTTKEKERERERERVREKKGRERQRGRKGILECRVAARTESGRNCV